MTIDDDQNAAIAQLQNRFQAANKRLDDLATAVQNGGDRITATEQRFAAGEARITDMERTVRTAVENFTPVATRVSELSSAAVAFNDRLNRVEQAIADLAAREPLPTEDRFAAIERAILDLGTRIGTVEAQRTRGGRLAQRLADIEARLPVEPVEGGTE